MLDQDQFQELTESYLKNLFTSVFPALGEDFDLRTPFGELGVDSFRVLKIIRELEVEFGTLPKTLLFENFNIEALARYFVDHHSARLEFRFSKGVETAPVQSISVSADKMAPGQETQKPRKSESVPEVDVSPLPTVSAVPVARQKKVGIRILEKDLPRHPELNRVVRELFERHKSEGCVSRGTRNIAPNLFIGSALRGYLNYCRSGDIILVYAYTGPEEYFNEVAQEIRDYCTDSGYQLNIFTDTAIAAIGDTQLSTTPFGVLQRVLNIQDFSLNGSKMRRLRYQVSKFEKSGKCHTEEYRCGTDRDVDRSIAELIDRWCETKPMVNPLVHAVKEEILSATLDAQHRIFLTYLDGVLQNAILITEMCGELNGYLMDLEFYPKDMPLGGLEYAIVRIMETLAAEGCDMLSLGGTYGCRIETSPGADPEIERVLDDLHKQGIFNDDGNLQFKNKFRPENRSIYLCRPVGSGRADNIVDIVMMIADPDRMQTSEIENNNAGDWGHQPRNHEEVAAEETAPLTVGDPRLRELMESGFNPLNIPPEQVDFDLKSDSWAQLDAPYVAQHMGHLRSQLQQPVSVDKSLKGIFPFDYFILSDAGRSAEHIFYKAWPNRGIVLQNLLFPTGIYHQIDKGFTPGELPHPMLLRSESRELYKADLHWDGLQAEVARRGRDIAFVCIEVSNNASGGLPVSGPHLRLVRELLTEHSIPLVLDGTRIVENARFLIERDREYAGKTTWEVVRDILSCADIVIASLPKDFCVDRGGVIATNDESLLRRLQAVAQTEGGGLDVIEKKLVGLALSNRRQIENRVCRRMEAVQALWSALKAADIPVIEPAGGHCVLIDVKRISQFANFQQPVASFLAWLYLKTGIRAGAHSVGMQENTAINGLVRLAVPVGLTKEDAIEIANRLVGLFRDGKDIPEIGLPGTASGDIYARYELIRYHRPTQAVTATGMSVEVAPHKKISPVQPQPLQSAPCATRESRSEIAIIGMAGRYPQAKNMQEFWENLCEGRDSVSEIPDDRLALRMQNLFTKRYRGGFIDGIDKFDSLFFNISPREAEVLDPQERLFLEVAWEALEDAGYYPETLVAEGAPRDVGVFVGAVWAMYQINGLEEKLRGNDANPNSFLWSIANRVSYWMNFTGPSLTLDTACSSSLTAIHLACEAIRNGDCSSAIVGGVNLDLHQQKFDINNSGGALSRDGVCRSFGAGANGYVAGEGVGAVLLKPLERALEDNDQVYGVIKSAVVNHGGRTSGYTVPNPKAQGELIVSALEKSGVDARTIGYIEAHGTGTELGDPVEISGLSRAFAKYEVGKQTCSIGSVKTNIGHLEAAAGVVGLCKVLLQMKYRRLVPSLHSARLNEHIDFDNSPFYVQQQLEPWQNKVLDGVALPLRAGISSFGAGGANAHVIVESYEQPSREEPIPEGDHVFPLSARSEGQLREMAERLQQYLERYPDALRLRDVAFTLQNGRKSFEHRLAIVARDGRELIKKLRVFVNGGRDDDLLFGNVKNAEGITKLLNRGEKEQFVGLLSKSRDLRKLAQLWIDGLLSDCRGFMATGSRVSLPTYPFADKRHWIALPQGGTQGIYANAGSGLHPLIDNNESTFQRQIFSKTFHEWEFFLRDHVVSGIPTLPGTAYLDLARKAGEVAAGRNVHKIRNITWISPLAIEKSLPVEAKIELKPNGDSVIFEVFSENDEGERRLHSQGRLVYASEHTVDPESEYIDIAAVKSRCNIKLTGVDAYRLFDSVGMHYGPSFQLLQEVYKNDDEALGLLELPAVRDADFDQFRLHPCLLDASMQAGVAGQLGDPSGEMKVPYSLGEVEILHPLTRTCYSYVTRAPGDRSGGSGLSRENVTIVDENGKVLAHIRECVGVPLTSVHEKSEPALSAPVREAGPAGEDKDFAELYYVQVWNPSTLTETQSDVSSLLLFDTEERLRDACHKRGIDVVLVLPGDRFEERDSHTFVIDPRNREGYFRLFEILNNRQWVVGKICFAWPDVSDPGDGEALGQALERSVFPFHYLCQALIEKKDRGDRTQVLYLYPGRPGLIQPHNDAVNGFLRSLRLENPRIDCKVLETDQDTTVPDDLLNGIVAELHAGAQDEMTVRYEGGSRYTRTLERLDAAELGETSSAAPALKHRGVYLITGGAGGLGLLFAEYLAKQCSARLVLTGRSQLSTERQARLEEIKAMGADVLYVAADVSEQEGVQCILQQAKERFGGIDGIIHSAGVLRDSFLRNKTTEEMAAVFAPKIFGTWYLDEQTRDEDLDFFVTFSSLAAVGGNAGQCDYAFANHYMDSFVAAREGLRKAGRRSGRALSLNWSLWADGGMKLDEQTEIFFRKNLGIRPLSREVGLGAFAWGLSTPHAQIAVLEGVRNKIERAWGLVKEEIDPVAPAAVATAGRVSEGTDGEKLSSAVIEELSKTVMDMLKVGADDIDLDSILLDLGFDSLGLTTFANRINDKYQVDINPVMFFEYPSIRAIAGVLTGDYGSAVQAAHGNGQSADTNGAPANKGTAAVPEVSDPGAPIAINKHWAGEPGSVSAPGTLSRQNRFVDEPIAIVGMAGVMPQSDNLDEFWQNLKNACDLVTEIPRDRWIWEDYDGDPIKDVNKSYSRWGGFMREVDKFDPLFFGITPREAEMMDPQQRILLETVWSAIEDSGHKVSDLSGTRTGVFIGVSAKDYIDVLAENEAALDGYSASGNSHSTLVNRISYLLNLRGPSAPLDTACSSSLIALHRAVESIHTGSSDMAIVGGVQVMLTPVAHISLSSAGMLSREGKCRTFNKDADGYVRGEGSGVIFIKPLARAIADGNPIHAVIKATAENHGGRVTNMTAPNPKAQAELLTEAYEKAQVDPSTVGFIECHGTGTSLGDPIEIQALKKAFSDLQAKQGRPAPGAPYCGLSSVKTNIGHLEPAAGIAGLLKALLAIRHKQIPALLHFEELNPYIDLDGSPFYIVDQTRPWQAMTAPDGSEMPRRVGVSSFGWGGANAHVVLEEWLEPRHQRADTPPVPVPIVLSAKNVDRLEAYARSLLAHVDRYDVALADLAYTLQVGRDAMTERLGFMAASVDEVKEKLKSFIAGDSPSGTIHRGRVSRKKDDISLIGEDEAIRASVVDKLIADNDWPKLLALWVKGLDMDWRQLRADGYLDTGGGRRISLPTYPFARERYWIDTKTRRKESENVRGKADTQDRAVSTAGSAGDLREESRTLFFREYWQPQAAPPLGATQSGRTIIFADISLKDTLLNDADAGHLGGAVLVYQAGDYQKISEGVYHCRFNDQAGIRNVLAQVAVEPDESLNIVYAWSRNRGEEGVHALFQLFTAIRESEHSVSHVTLVGEYDPRRADTCWDYSWIGFERSLKLYLGRTRISLLYSDTRSVTVWQLLDAGRRGGVVWYREGRRLALSCKPFEPGKEGHTPVVKQGGGYLITGGCGALGLHVAQHLARHYNAKLLLTGRRPLSPEIQRQLEALKEAGAREALYASVDLGDRSAMSTWAKSLPFALSGIIHAAGVESDQAFFEKSSGDIDRVLHPKTSGTLLLDDVLESQPLDFICYFSSSSALLGDFGSCDYAIANRFQMAYGIHRQQRGRENGRTIVINWPLWQAGGMGVADPEQAALYLKRTGLSALGTDEGLKIWDDLVSGGQHQTLVMTGQPSRIVALVDKLYPLEQQPSRMPSGAAVPRIELVHKVNGSARGRRRGQQPGNLNVHKVERLKQLIKADLLSLQEAGK